LKIRISDQQHRAFCLFHRLFRDAPDEVWLQTRLALGGDHGQIAPPPGSLLSVHWIGKRGHALTLFILIILLILVYVLLLMPVLQSTMTLPPSVKIVFSLLLITPAALVMGMPFPLGIRLLTGTADQKITWAWGINGRLSVVSTVLGTVIALEMGFVRVMILAAFVYCMTFLGGGWAGLLRPEAFRSIPPWQPPMTGTRIRHSRGSGNQVPYSWIPDQVRNNGDMFIPPSCPIGLEGFSRECRFAL